MKKCVLIWIAAVLFSGTAFAQTYVGDTMCAGCHANFPEAGFYDGYKNSGHPWKIFRTEGNTPAADTWPHTPVPPLPMAFGNQLQWSDVEYTIGNFFWKTRYVDRDGYIWTGDANDTTQWNIATQAFVPYHPDEVRPFNCGRCHTTGYDPAGNQNGLPGLIGTWTEDGIRCEACHGPASDHVSNPTIPPPGGKDCSECHYRDAQFRMPWKGGFMRHHQQAEDLSHSPHQNLDCSTCHNPHRSVVYDDGGTITTCSQCHPGDMANNFYVVEGMESVSCEDCHMPKMAKSAVAFNAYTADVSGHLFRIMTDPIAAADNVTDGFWNQDVNGDASITLDYACLGCHEEIGSPLTLAMASMVADGIHGSGSVPVTIAGFAATETNNGVLLTWQLSSESLRDAFEINVQRAEFREGPYVDRTPSGLQPGLSMSFEDNDVERGVTYFYRVAATDVEGVLSFAGPQEITYAGQAWRTAMQGPTQSANGDLALRYTVGTPASVRIEIYDVAGRQVTVLDQGFRARGEYTVNWNRLDRNGASVARGTYLARLQAGQDAATQKFVILHR